MSTATFRRPSPYAKTWQLITSMDRAGWGTLAAPEYRGVRIVLKALVSLLPYKSATGVTTVTQIADTACYTPEWVRRALRVLEDLDVIKWTRGYIRDGVAVPSAIRIVKTKLVELIEHARPIRDAKDAARRAETAARIKAAHLHNTRPSKRNRRSRHAKSLWPSASREEYGSAGGRSARARSGVTATLDATEVREVVTLIRQPAHEQQQPPPDDARERIRPGPSPDPATFAGSAPMPDWLRAKIHAGQDS